MRVAILSPSLTSGDAVSNDVLGMFASLRQRAETRVFAEGWTLDEPRIFPFEQIRSFLKKPGDILIYHFSRGWEPGGSLIADLNCRKVIKYHNITPPNFLDRYNADFAGMCLEGRQQLRPIAMSGCDLFLSDSAFNMQELIDNGAAESNSFVVPPFHHVDRLHTMEPDAEVINRYQNGSVNICTVGRVAPNKGHVDLIRAFAAYHHDYNPKSRLIIVGKEETRLGKYSRLLRELIRRLDLNGAVKFTGEVTDRQLKAYYSVANVFVTTSEHEGFCVPLIEAMALNVPIAAYASSAIPETVGAAGLVWEERNPELLAESINSIVRDRATSAGLSALGTRRYHELFTNERIRERFIGVLRRITTAGTPLAVSHT